MSDHDTMDRMKGGSKQMELNRSKSIELSLVCSCIKTLVGALWSIEWDSPL